MTKLAQVNLKLNADNKVMRAEHDSMQHSIYKVEKRCSRIVEENLSLKEQIQQLRI